MREWVKDYWHDNYGGTPVDGGAQETLGDGRRVLRGGSWDDQPRFVRSADRNGDGPGYRLNRVGFRLAQDL